MPAPSSIVAGIVTTQAVTMLLTTDHLTAESLFEAPTPIMEAEMTCVVLTGAPTDVMLANPPGPIRREFDAYGGGTPADLGLQWLWDQPEVTLVLSGMSAMAQLEENLGSACRSGVGSLSAEDRDFLSRIRGKYEEKRLIPCTGCAYCMPCPNGVEIPRGFKFFNDGYMNVGALKDKRYDEIRREFKDYKKAAGPVMTKMIIEVCYLTDDEIKAAWPR